MPHRPSIRLVALLLALFVSPFHLAVVQVVGWTYMYASARVDGDSASEAMTQTFNGSAPCVMCHLVESLSPGQQEQQPASVLSAAQLILPIPLAVTGIDTSIPPRAEPLMAAWNPDEFSWGSADATRLWLPPS